MWYDEAHTGITYILRLMANVATFTVFNALIACGVDNIAMFMEQTQAERICRQHFRQRVHVLHGHHLQGA
jgi:hypothetical protein